MDSATGGKFWEIEAEGKRTTVRYGALSASRARVHKKEHASKAEALEFAADQIRSKERKGYAEVKPAPNVSPQKSSPEKKRRSSPAVEPATAKRKKTPAPSGAVISDCTFLLTGTLSVKRSEVEAEICRHGGHIGTISKATHLLCGEDGYGTKKHQEAEKRGLPVVTEEWVRSLFSGGGSGAGCSGSRAGRGSGGGASGKCSCGNVLTADSKFCSRCGKEAPEQPATCSCGNLLTADANYCSRCGKKVAATEGPPAADDLFKPVRVALGGADNKELMGSATYTLEEVGLKDGSKLEVFARACWKKYLENAFSKHRNRGKGAARAPPWRVPSQSQSQRSLTALFSPH